MSTTEKILQTMNHVLGGPPALMYSQQPLRLRPRLEDWKQIGNIFNN